MLLALLFAWFGYKKARDAGRNPIAWAAAAAGVFIGTQAAVGLTAGFVIGLGIDFWDWPDTTINDLEIYITIAAIAVSIATGLLVLKYIERPAEAAASGAPPPPPEDFDNLN